MFHGQKSNIFWDHTDLSYPSISLHMGKSLLPFMAWRRLTVGNGAYWSRAHDESTLLGIHGHLLWGPISFLECGSMSLLISRHSSRKTGCGIWHWIGNLDSQNFFIDRASLVSGSNRPITEQLADLPRATKPLKSFDASQHLSWLLKEKDWQYSQSFAIIKVGVQHTAHEAQWGWQEHPIWHLQGIQESLYTV